MGETIAQRSSVNAADYIASNYNDFEAQRSTALRPVEVYRVTSGYGGPSSTPRNPFDRVELSREHPVDAHGNVRRTLDAHHQVFEENVGKNLNWLDTAKAEVARKKMPNLTGASISLAIQILLLWAVLVPLIFFVF